MGSSDQNDDDAAGTLSPSASSTAPVRSAASCNKVNLSFTQPNNPKSRIQRDPIHIRKVKKDEGKHAFVRKNYELAARCWREGTEAAAELDVRSQSEEDERRELQTLLQLNLLQAHLKLGDNEKGLKLANTKINIKLPSLDTRADLKKDCDKHEQHMKLGDKLKVVDDLRDKLSFRKFECLLGIGDWKIARQMIEAIKETPEHRVLQDLDVVNKDAVGFEKKVVMYHNLYRELKQVNALLKNLQGYLEKTKAAGTSGNCSDAAINLASSGVVEAPECADAIDDNSTISVSSLCDDLQTLLSTLRKKDGKFLNIWIAKQGVHVLADLVHGMRPKYWMDEVKLKIPEALDEIKAEILSVNNKVSFDVTVDENGKEL